MSLLKSIRCQSCGEVTLCKSYNKAFLCKSCLGMDKGGVPRERSRSVIRDYTFNKKDIEDDELRRPRKKRR